jgi:DNA repair exonuclease SbcCD nuclease subunit
MARGYVYKKPLKRSHYSNFRRRLFMVFGLIAIAGVIGYFIYTSTNSLPKSSPKSAAEITVINGNKTTFTNDYFQFEDTGTWVIDKNNSDAQKITYHKFRKNILLHEMIVYINHVPIPLYLDTPKVLPLRIVNNNKFDVTNVSSPCVSQYAKGELHKVKEVSINGATMLCDPDSPQYYVALSEINGDYRLHLKRPNGTPIQFIVTYKDLGLDPQPTDLMNVATSFQPR